MTSYGNVNTRFLAKVSTEASQSGLNSRELSQVWRVPEACKRDHMTMLLSRRLQCIYFGEKTRCQRHCFQTDWTVEFSVLFARCFRPLPQSRSSFRWNYSSLIFYFHAFNFICLKHFEFFMYETLKFNIYIKFNNLAAADLIYVTMNWGISLLFSVSPVL